MPFPSTRNALYLLFFPTLTVAAAAAIADAEVEVAAGMEVELLPLLIAVAAGACVAAGMAVGGGVVGVAAGAQALTSKVKAMSAVTIRVVDFMFSPLKELYEYVFKKEYVMKSKFRFDLS